MVPRCGGESNWASDLLLAAAYICHSFSSTPVAAVCTRATVFQGSHCWHLRFLWRSKVTPLHCFGSDTLLLPHRFILCRHMLQPPPATLLSLSQNSFSTPQQESRFQLQMESTGRWKLNDPPALFGRILGGNKKIAPQNVFESFPPIVVEINLGRCYTMMRPRRHLTSLKTSSSKLADSTHFDNRQRKQSKIFFLILQSHQQFFLWKTFHYETCLWCNGWSSNRFRKCSGLCNYNTGVVKVYNSHNNTLMCQSTSWRAYITSYFSNSFIIWPVARTHPAKFNH